MEAIRTKRLLLRRPDAADLDQCARLLGDFDVVKTLARVPYPYDMASGKDYLARTADIWPLGAQAGSLTFFLEQERVMIGALTFKDMQRSPGIGYWLGKPYWGQGLMSEAIAAGLKWFFASSAQDVVVAGAMTENEGSKRVLVKQGFEVTGHGQIYCLARDCEIADTNYRLTREAFNALREERERQQ